MQKEYALTVLIDIQGATDWTIFAAIQEQNNDKVDNEYANV